MTETITIEALASKVRDRMMKLNYTPTSFYLYESTWERFNQYAKNKGTTKFTVNLADEFLRDRFDFPNCRSKGKLGSLLSGKIRAIRVLKDFNEYGILSPQLFQPVTPCPEPFAAVYEKYLQHCIVPGRGEVCIDQYMRVAKQFFIFLHERGLRHTDSISMSLVEGFLEDMRGFTKYTLKMKHRTLKGLLSFLSTEYGIEDFSRLVPRVIAYTKGHVPTALPQKDIDRILSSMDRGNPLGKRDYAIVLLAADLGLRSSDISSLTFESFNWPQKRLHLVQDKTQNSLELPLPKRVSNAIVEYVKYGRPKTKEPYIFVQHKAPYRKMRNLYDVMGRALRASGIKLEPEVSHGLHILRHSLATNLLAGGVPMSTITEILGQRNVITTEIYVHSDTEHLRQCALNPEVFANG